ncbi:MAG: DUF6745 domain-containing protein [Candidatus Eremiobacterota bacterium]
MSPVRLPLLEFTFPSPGAARRFLDRAQEQWNHLAVLPGAARAWSWLEWLETTEVRSQVRWGGGALVSAILTVEHLAERLSQVLERPLCPVRLVLKTTWVQPTELVPWGTVQGPVGPALRWSDGYVEFLVGEHWLDHRWVVSPEKLGLADLEPVPDRGMRRALMRRLGTRRAVESGLPTVLHEDVDGAGMPRRLLRLEVPGDEAMCVVEVVCPSTGERHYLRVPPGTRTCQEGVAWTFQLRSSGYRPVAEA